MLLHTETFTHRQLLHTEEKRCERMREIEHFTSVFGDRTSFRAKGLRTDKRNRKFTSVFGDRTSFRAKGLRFVPSRWHCPAPSREKWKRSREQEGKRARGQERM